MQLSLRAADRESMPWGAQVLEKAGYILLRGRKQHTETSFQKLGKSMQVAIIGLDGERPQTFLDPQVSHVFAQQGEIARCIHYPIIRLAQLE